jgi:hypothetical protein
LAGAPHLAALYIQWSNRSGNIRLVRLSFGLVIGTAIWSWLVWIRRSFFADTFNLLQHHTVTVAVLSGVCASAIVSRQRRIHAVRAGHSWLAALPVNAGARRVEALTLQLLPIIVALVLVSGVGLLTGAIFTAAALSPRAGIIAWRSLLLGASTGAAVGLVIPSPKPEIPSPGSRYVPPPVTRGGPPVPSVASLGIWPIRRMFAMLQPKILARTMTPLLLAIPLGSTAATAMIWVGLFCASLALVFLGMSVIWVAHAARLWLTPLPLLPQRLRRVVVARSLIVMASIGAIATWLVWVGST